MQTFISSREMCPYVKRSIFLAGVAMLTCMAAGDLTAEPLANATPKPVEPLIATPPASNRTLLSLPAKPDDFQIFTLGGLAEPLVPIGGKEGEDNATLAASLHAYVQRQDPLELTALEEFCRQNPNSRWTPAVLTNLGLLYYYQGYFSRAKVAFWDAWQASKNVTEGSGKELADRALGEYALILARVGEMKELDALLADVKTRTVNISSQVRLDEARQGQWHMHNKPERAFLCGPFALKAVAKESKSDKQVPEDFLKNVKSTPTGFSLEELENLAAESAVPMQVAHRAKGAAVITPCIAHWKIGHFGAILREENGAYFMEDPTFRDDIRMSEKAIDDESSGYFLVPAGKLPKGWKKVTPAESRGLYGKGHSGTTDEDETEDCDEKSGNRCGLGKGMPIYSFHSMLCSLSVTDTPLPPTASVGESISYTVTYNQRENENLSGNRVFTNFSPQWVSSMCSWMQENTPGSVGTNIELRLPNGGGEEYTGYNSVTKQYARQRGSRAILKRVENGSGVLVGYERTLPNGLRFLYSHAASPRFFLKQIIAPSIGTGTNTTVYSYDADESIPNPLPGRLRKIYTAENRFAQFEYSDLSFPYQPTKVIDPWGRSASFSYDATGKLQSITDAVGLISTFEYESNGFMKAMITPYGRTDFATGYPDISYGMIAWVQATDPLGGVERIEMNLSDTETGVPNIYVGPIPTAPGLSIATGDNDDRNTFFWSKKAWEEAKNLTGAAKYGKAHLYHWLQPASGADASTGVLQAEKAPLESRIWYNYPGQTSSHNVGSHDSPSKIARLLDDGSTQLYQREYNDAGSITKSVDPVGRETICEYFSNGVDLQFSKQKVAGGTYVTVEEYGAYHANGAPTWRKDAGGQLTQFTFTADGLPDTATNPLGQIVRLVYGETAGSPDLRQLIRTEHKASAGSTATTLSTVSRQVLTIDNKVVTRQTSTNADGLTKVQDFDALMRPIKRTHPDGTYVEYLYDRLDVSWSRDRLGRWTERHYNARRELEFERNPEGYWTQHDWCSCGAREAFIDGNGNRTSWFYDLQGRVTHKVYADGKGKTFVYEKTSSRLRRKIDGLGQVTEYSYFADNALQKIDYQSEIITTPNVTCVMDPYFPRITAMEDGTGTTSYTYYPMATGQLGAGKLQTIDGPLTNDTIELIYDELGRNKEERINGVARGRSFDALGRIDSLEDSLGTFDYSYIGAGGRVDFVDYPNGQKTDYAYHGSTNDLRVESITHLLPGAVQLSKHVYDYNSVGNITSWTQQQESLSVGNAETYSYDAIDQLVGVHRTNLGGGALTRQDFSYDGAQNRTGRQEDSEVIEAVPNALNQVIKVDGGGSMRLRGTVNETSAVKVNGRSARMLSNTQFEASVTVDEGTNNFSVEAKDANNNVRHNYYSVSVAAAPTRIISYDANGNTINDGMRTFEWDAENRLVAINYLGSSPAKRSEFVYDGRSRLTRVIEKEATVTLSDKWWIYLGYEEAELRDSVTNAVEKRIFALGEVRPGATSPANKLFYTRDHLGSVRELVDDSGAVRARYGFDSWGRRSKLAGDLDAEFGYTGHWLHSVSGLYSAPFRFYDSELAHWISRDPIEEEGGFNLYGYAFNSPVRWNDPTGLFAAAAAAAPAVCGMAAEIWAVGALAVAVAYDTSKPGPGTGDCSIAEHAALQAAVDAANITVGSLGRCKHTDCCWVLRTKLAAWLALAAARSVINTRCYKGGDTVHQQVLADAFLVIGNCQRLIDSKCK